jgi:serine/threonine protein phosphatase PrpC
MTTEGISQRLHVALVPDFHALVLMTDGITDPLFPTEVSLGDKDVWLDFWTELWKQAQITPDNAQACDELLKWSHFYSKGNHDDRTIALLLPQEIKPDAT